MIKWVEDGRPGERGASKVPREAPGGVLQSSKEVQVEQRRRVRIGRRRPRVGGGQKKIKKCDVEDKRWERESGAFFGIIFTFRHDCKSNVEMCNRELCRKIG